MVRKTDRDLENSIFIKNIAYTFHKNNICNILYLIYFLYFNIMVCTKKNTNKYRFRESPPYSAMDCKGLTKKGNNGVSYTSRPDKRGIYRWVGTTSKMPRNNKTRGHAVPSDPLPIFEGRGQRGAVGSLCTYKKNDYGKVNVSQFIKCIKNDTLKLAIENGATPKNIYEINDNASFPFVVFQYEGSVDIYNNRYNETFNKEELNNKLMSVKYEQIFLGDNDLNDAYWTFKRGIAKGNTILLHLGKGKYILIGKGIVSFSTKNGDIIRNFYSSIGGNYDSFPYAVGDKYVYLINEKKYAPIGEFDINKDVCRQYYCYEIECKKYKTMNLLTKTIHPPYL